MARSVARLPALAIGFACAICAAPARATEPLHDELTFGERSGYIFPAQCCWLALPESEALTAMRRAERCSAIGGPVGRYRYADDKIWLVGLRRCGGPVPLNDVFPELETPAHAVWLSGEFRAKLDWLCRAKDNSSVFAVELALRIERGNVVSTKTQRHDRSACD